MNDPHIQLISYNQQNQKYTPALEASLVASQLIEGQVNWVDIVGLDAIEQLRPVSEHFGLHSLTHEDIHDIEIMPKLEFFENYTLVILPMFAYDVELKRFQPHNISLVFGKNYLLSFHRQPSTVFQPIIDRIVQGLGRVRKKGADYLLYLLMQAVLNHNEQVLEEFREDLEEMEESLILDVDEESVKEIVFFKKELSKFRKILFPVKDLANRLKQDDLLLVDKKNLVFFRHLHEQVLEMEHTYQNFKDILAHFMDLYISGLSQNMNKIMKTLTLITTIFIPMSFIAGFYGMNFKHMPELNYPWAYPVAIVVMLSCGLGMYFYMRKRKWV
ncbi:magnesium/cobalt transporter CorA [Microscilla marina]|uniref:Magnesium transport protein CorA n=1 Tax=Microscilla marina ATCC 23134 TaxID=313606 RepID=A1ZXE7_MICM2|nr:magnesium/cobalt transporter CorA [Microscilla marina]EAY24915.1 magnesium and cobalt transport protein CorA [Microscilla marina ATCC 23134]